MKNKISFFERYLTIWVLLCMIIGILISKYIPFIPNTLNNFEYYNVSVPIAILLFIMIFPMMLKVDFTSLKTVKNDPRGLYITWIINWLIKPFTMYLISYLFFFVIFSTFISSDIATQYIAGAILLGTAPCTAMVFVWSKLTNGNPTYTVVQVATNDLLIFALFAPIAGFLLNVSSVYISYTTLFLSIVLFVVVPLVSGVIVRSLLIKYKGVQYFNKFILFFDKFTMIGLLLTLVLIFSFQGSAILNNPFDIILISIPLIIQTIFIFALGYFIAYKLKLKHNVAAPASLIGASNFFELSVAVAISLFGLDSPAVLVTIVGVLVEVPVMLILCRFTNNSKSTYEKRINE